MKFEVWENNMANTEELELIIRCLKAAIHFSSSSLMFRKANENEIIKKKKNYQEFCIKNQDGKFFKSCRWNCVKFKVQRFYNETNHDGKCSRYFTVIWTFFSAPIPFEPTTRLIQCVCMYVMIWYDLQKK